MNKNHSALAALACLIATSTVAQPVPDDTIEQAWGNFEAVWQQIRDGEATWDDLRSAYGETLSKLPFERMSARQIARLPQMVFQFGDGMERSLDRLDVLLDENPDDPHALLRLADLLFWSKAFGYDKPINNSRERVIGLIDSVLGHPRLAETVEDGTASLLPTLLLAYGSSPEGLDARRRGFDTLIQQLEASTSANDVVAVEIGARWSALKDAGYDEPTLTAYRDLLLPRVQAALRTAEAADQPDVETLNTISRATSAVGMLTSAAATRDFVGMEAPDLSIEWSSTDSISSLEDLRGKVVLLHFWVTGCGHCINALPTVRALAERYENTDVVILGVTSLQGRHHDPEANATIDTSGEPDREYALMQEFIASQEITWPIVFTAESAWNPDYEVRGTPHMTLVDPAGTVVANDLHPRHGVEANAERINAVLAGFGLAVPGDETRGD